MKPDFSLFVLQVRFIEDVIGTIMSGAVYFYSEILVGILTSLINTHTRIYIHVWNHQNAKQDSSKLLFFIVICH